MIHFLHTLRKKSFFVLLGMFITNFAIATSDEIIWENGCPSYNEFDAPIFDSDACCGSERAFELSATLLYLKAAIEDAHFVLSSIENIFNNSHYPNGRRHQPNTHYNPGFSVEALLEFQERASSLAGRFTYFHERAKKTVLGEFLYDTNGYPGFGAQDSPLYTGTAFAKNIFTLYSGDITYNQTFFGFCPDKLKFMFGLHVASIKFVERTRSSGNFTSDSGLKPLLNDLRRSSKFCGVGPQVGIEYQFLPLDFCFCDGILAFSGNARGAILCGHTKSDLSFITLRTGPVGVGVRNGGFWRIIPAASAGLGINYTMEREFSSISIDAGYEFIWYGNCVAKPTGLDVAFSGDTIDVINSLSLHGPYLRLAYAF
jgi:Legionella pneumophila major outer membrane protein precursor